MPILTSLTSTFLTSLLTSSMVRKALLYTGLYYYGSTVLTVFNPTITIPLLGLSLLTL